MNERDPVGDKIRLKERAEEDQYFAAQDRELIAKLHHTQESEQEHTLEELARHRCAKCGTRLEQHHFRMVSIDECPACHGVWLDHAALMALSKRDTGEWVASFLDGLVRVVAHPKD